MGIKTKLGAGGSVLGGFVFSSDPSVSEIYADAGFDFCVIDLEHAPNDIPGVLNHIRACQARGIDALVRVGPTSEGDIPRLLDAGACGIMLPHFGLPDRPPVAGALRYPPHGSRPTCTGIRGAEYGLMNFPDYVARSDASVFGIGLIEDSEAIEHIGDASSQGIDCIMPGPMDLASSLGVHGQAGHPKVIAAVEEALRRGVEKNIATGMYVASAAGIAQWHEKGARLFVLSIDYKILSTALKSSRIEFESLVARLDRPAVPAV